MNWANLITYFRMLLIPMVVLSYYSELQYANMMAAMLFSLASLSDWLDGYLARRLNQTSEFGAFLDPVADKLLVVTVLIMLVGELNPLLTPTIVIIAREVLISALREWMATRGHREAVAVAFSGKLKTTFQMIAIVTLILVTESSPDWLLMTGFVMIYIAALLSLYSALHYFKAARPYLTP
ncbi:MAG TPA: CDP-diacylglycerol--glycerol-3-phosphate 3-phosphatidyltransferase [Gammaproteobacteria bacterium]|jgi:CDP-diacylglycerol--glycerol-3-phosphate 3-phosphatidyltransferase|nr:CDP-diacylglycerol--glycerol-3-phosphate 3-phosphatidyltransferase [Gammaproteobacteria bacterium]OUX32894.1 MAG: CDP-diacylglycerol--glycerol-3-phosphate 3-phosphatidyltransferase [Gammaproteobacteria bacterium TMED260]HBP99749.1 CDP-diacylglycerol--glycerol-3-phosphate 3-phosphatidyltransferase [Gammaproteobacteria bacterium]HCA37011.1 CDP-diacylglycerol--glycerol-3-phosphate 3-phosphatidyltransferase [Gammaproteobacteria bacterium]|tara:strand:- start:592 stop:1134 length:543 start_codon:yes stop_codon:yes gene_type:complete